MDRQTRIGIIDGHQLVWRVVGASPLEEPRVHAGRFLSWASLLHRYHRTSSLFVAWDVGASFRRKIFPAYKLHRKKDDNHDILRRTVQDVMKMLVPVVEAMGIPQVYRKGFEADDVIYSLAVKSIDDPDVEVLVYSMDADLLQLVRFDRIKIVYPQGKPLGRRFVEAKFGIPPEHLQTLKALAGDSSDGYKGVKGIGPVKAASLISAFGGLFDIYAALDDGKIDGVVASKLAAGRDDARVSWKLAALRLIVYNERRSPPDRDRAMKLIFSNRIREGLDPEIFNALFVEEHGSRDS